MVGTVRCAVRAPICNGNWPFADTAARRPYQFFRIKHKSRVAFDCDVRLVGSAHCEWEVLRRLRGSG